MANQDSQNFSDHLEIQKVLNLYASALDKQNWSELEQVFTPDAVANFIGIGEFAGLEAITGLVSSVLTQCASTQHLSAITTFRSMVMRPRPPVIWPLCTPDWVIMPAKC